MKFSVIIPVYKVEPYLSQCVTSMLSQSFGDFELLLIDDGSPDNCPQLCDEWAAKDGRVKVYHKQNGGLSDARNYGLSKALGDYIVFLDSDDWWDDINGLEKIARRLDETKADVLILGSRKYFESKNSYSTPRVPSSGLILADSEETYKSLMNHADFVACAWDKVIRRTFIEQNRLFFTIGQLGEDVEWCCKLLLLRPSITLLNQSIHIYRQGNVNSITFNISDKNIMDLSGVIKKYSALAKENASLPLLHFLALEYLLWMVIATEAKSKECLKDVQYMKDYYCLFNYAWYPRIRKVAKIKFLGFNGVFSLLRLFLRIR